MDVLAFQDQYDDALDSGSESELSEAGDETFRSYLHNYPPNLRILSKSDDKGNANPTYVRDTLPGSLKKEARKTVKAARKEFGETQDETKADNYWKQTRKRRRKSLNKKRAHNN